MNKFTLNNIYFLFSLVILWPLSFPVEVRSQIKPCSNQPDELSSYVGRYLRDDGLVLLIEDSDGELTLRPLFWRSIQPVERLNGDSFDVKGRADRKVDFTRDANNCVAAAKVAGFDEDSGTFYRLGDKKAPLELLFSGEPQEAAGQMIKANPGGIEDKAKIAQLLLEKYHSKCADVVKFLIALAEYFPRTSSVYAVLGNAYMATGERKSAVKSYLKAYELDTKNETALKGLRRLRALPKSALPKTGGWNLPFSLDKVFVKPTGAEIEAVRADWSKRDLSAKNVIEEASGQIDLGFSKAVVKIISHSVLGRKNYGAIIIPDGLQGKAPVILDLKGVSPDYFPLDLNRLHSPRFLGTEQKRFIYFVPSFRGEVLKFGGVDYISEGDRTDVWDGATDDSLAFLNAALSITPEADANRICAFGKSRGGTLALLAGIRDPKIKLVIDWSGPADWFELMATEGWTQQEIMADGLLNRAKPEDDGGQFVETFLAKVLEGKWGLREVRSKMLASSPLYFLESLPRTQIHYGIEDEMVPTANGYAIESSMRKSGRKTPNFEAFFYPNVGHDLNYKIASRASKKAVLSLLPRSE
jgi:tetratricopeptide (TPR) repeat protein